MELPDYLAAIRGDEVVVADLVREADVRCPRCDSGGCAKSHAWRYRKRVYDLATGDCFHDVPILRVCFCDGSTSSLTPAELWRGRFTVSSVLETVVHVLRDGIDQAFDWTLFAGTGQPVISRRTLGRWRKLVHTRLVGSAWSWLGPRVGLSWSDHGNAAAQLAALLDRLSASITVAFRAVTGRAVLDKPTGQASPPRSTARRVAGRLAVSAPHDRSSEMRPRGSWSVPRRQRSPPPDRHGGR